MRRFLIGVAALMVGLSGAACRRHAPAGPPRASGYVEATDVRVAAKLGGRIEKVNVVEGAHVNAGDVLVTLATTDVVLAISRVRAERDQAVANLRLLLAGTRPEDIHQLEAQVAAAAAERQAGQAELEAARTDEARFEQLLRNKAGAQKQLDDATARRELAEARLKAAADRVTAANAALARAKAGAREEEIAAARARVAAVDAQIASLEHDRGEATVIAPMTGIVSSRLVEPGEIVALGAPLIVIIDLDHAWANVYVEEPIVPTLRIDQAATVLTDAGNRLAGRISFISPRAEFTPRNVQTAEERAKLVYRVKVSVDNREGILKPGMPVEVQFGATQ